MISAQPCWLRGFLSFTLILVGSGLPSFAVQAQTPRTAPLIQSNNLTYLGSFKLPSGTLGSTYGFGYAGTEGNGTYGITYNPTNNSLFIGGHPYEQKLAEISIPQSFSGTPTATALQNLSDPLEGKLGSINPGDPNAKIVGSAFIYQNRLYLGGYAYYDGAGTQTKSQFVRPTNLSIKGQVLGPFAVGNIYPGWVDKYAALIPGEWQSAFGGSVFVGGSGGAINSLQSWGPSASVINPVNIGVVNPVPATLVLGYPIGHPLADTSIGNPYWSQADVITGMVFPQGTRSILYFGKHGSGAYCYGTGAECNDPDDSSKGTHAYPYESHVWAYDANDLLAVKNAQKQSWEIKPYAVWRLDSSFIDVQGAAYDPVTQRLFISAVCQDSNCAPIIRVYQINNVTTTATPALPTVSISANPTSIVAGDSSALSWSSTNSTLCTASGAWSGTKPTSGSQTTGALTTSATYSLTCTGAGGSANRSTTVSVTAVTATPTVSVSVNPSSINSGGSSMISWSSTNATSCTASGGWSGTKAISGSQSTAVLTASASYLLTCTGTGGSAGDSATVVVNATSPTAPSSASINVANISGLQSAIASLTSNSTILLADGTYSLSAPLYLPQNVSNITIRGASGNRDSVIIKGPGMTNSSVAFGFWADNVNGITFQDMTIRDINQHAIILNGGVDSPTFRNLHIVDIGDQFLKNNPTADRLNGVDNGRVENSLLEYSATAPDYYTNGVDVHRGKNWVVRGNTFKNFRSATGLAGPAILMWNGSSDTTVVRNTFINNQRDISFGLDPSVPADQSPDHARGLIANNFMYKTSAISPDVPIAVFDSPQTNVYYNTILVNGSYPNAIEYRFAGTTGVDIKNNLADANIVSRDGASGSISNNVTNATSVMFVNPGAGDLHLKQTATAAIDKGIAISVTDDFDGQVRAQGSASDIGADEFSPSTTTTLAPTAPSNLVLQ